MQTRTAAHVLCLLTVVLGTGPCAAEAPGRPAISFEANCGQTDSRVEYLCRGPGFVAFFTPDEIVFKLQRPAVGLLEGRLLAARHHGDALGQLLQMESLEALVHRELGADLVSVVSMKIVGASPRVTVGGEGATGGQSHYLLGSDPAAWTTHLRHSARLRYSQVYPGIDLVFYERGGQLEFDFVVAPGADPELIQFEMRGVDELRVRDGDLVAVTPSGLLCQRAPVLTQERDGALEVVPGCFAVESQPVPGAPAGARVHRVGFDVGAYDSTRELVIDPVVIYSTYLGGSSTDDIGGFQAAHDYGDGVVLDDEDRLLVVGRTTSTDFPTFTGLQPARAASSDGFITLLDRNGTSVVFSTYLGGSGSDSLRDVDLTASGEIVVVGDTTSADFPGISLGAVKATLGVGVNDAMGAGCSDVLDNKDVVVARLARDGGAVLAATYYGGNARCRGGASGPTDFGMCVHVNAAGEVYVGGQTNSTDLPLTANAFQTTLDVGGTSEAFVAALSEDLTTLIFSSYIGSGNFFDAIMDIKEIESGHILAVGEAGAGTPGITAGVCNSGGLSADIYAAHIDPTAPTPASALIWGRCLGAAGATFSQYATACEIVDTGFSTRIYITGAIDTGAFPTVACLDCTRTGSNDAFLIEANEVFGSVFAGVTFADYVGGSGADEAFDLGVDPNGTIWLTGRTSSTDFPGVTGMSIQPSNLGQSDGFLIGFDSTLSAIHYSTYWGGSNFDRPVGMDIGPAGDIYIGGATNSNDLLTTSPAGVPLQPGFGGGSRDGFVVRINEGLAILTVTAVPPTVTEGSTGHQVSFTVRNNLENSVNISATSLGLRDTGGADVVAEYVMTPAPGNPTVIPAQGMVALAFTLDVAFGATLGLITIDGFVEGTDSVRGGTFTDRTADEPDAWTVTLLPCLAGLCGDCDRSGRVDILDALVAARMAAGLVLMPTWCSATFANCNAAGVACPAASATISIVDALAMARYVVGLSNLICC